MSVYYVNNRFDLLKIFLGRYQAFQVTYAKFPKFGLDANRHDLSAFHLVCWQGNKIAGYYRLCDRDFAFKNTFKILTSAKVMEASRAYIPKAMRGQRSSTILLMLWREAAKLASGFDVRYIVGRGSVKCDDAQVQALCRDYASNRQDILEIAPLFPIKNASCDGVRAPNMPSLLKRYFSLGIKFSGEPGWNPQLKLYDIFIVCDLHDPKNFFYEG